LWGWGELVLTQKKRVKLDKIGQICGNLGVIIKKVWSFKNYKAVGEAWGMGMSPKSRKNGLKSVKIMKKYGGAYVPP